MYQQIFRLGVIAISSLMLAGTVTGSAPPIAQAQIPTKIWLPLVQKPLGTFDVARDGFSFANYSPGQSSRLTSVEMQRLFGSAVCASVISSDGTCTLSPPVASWMEWANSSMRYGVCEGMAVVSRLMFTGQLNPRDFGAAQIRDLTITGNTRLQREIAFWSASTLINRQNTIKSSPNAVLAALQDQIASAGLPFGTLRFSQPDLSGGHAVLPLSIRSLSPTQVAISVYDSNYPGQNRELFIDTAANSWFYSPDPAMTVDDYTGTAQSQTLGLAPLQPRLQAQQCPLCKQPSAPPITSTLGGFVNDSYISSGIPNDSLSGKYSTTELNAANSPSNLDFNSMFPAAPQQNAINQILPSWQIPSQGYYTTALTSTVEFIISQPTDALDGEGTTFYYIGRGFVFEVGEVESGNEDRLGISGGNTLTYRTSSGEVPELLIGLDDAQADFSLLLSDFEMEAGDQVSLHIGSANKLMEISVNTTSPNDSIVFSMAMERLASDVSEVFDSTDDGVTLADDDVLLIDYSQWDSNGSPLRVGYDDNGNGVLDDDEAFLLQDSGDIFEP